MKTKITFEFASTQEAQDFLAKQGTTIVEAAPIEAAPTTVGDVVPAMHKCVKADLVALCQSRGIVISNSMTKAQLHAMLTGSNIADAPMAEIPPTITQAATTVPQAATTVPQAATTVPQAATTVPSPTLTPVDNTPVGPSHPLMAKFKEAYNAAMANGILAPELAALVGRQLQAVGYADAKLGSLPAHVVTQFIDGFVAEVTLKTTQAAPQVAPSNGGFI